MSETEETSVISGEGIDSIKTLGTWYDNNCIQVCIDDVYYRMDVSKLIGIFAELDFYTEKKRVHTYIEPCLDGMHDSIYKEH